MPTDQPEPSAPLAGLREPLVLTPDEAAEWLKIGHNAIYELLRLPGFPALHHGRIVRIPVIALRRWVNGPGLQVLRRPDSSPPEQGL